MDNEKEKIDFVLLWVDDNDPKWIDEYNKYRTDDGDTRSLRYRDMDLLKYWFRAVEKFTPWVNNIYFVTCGQKPDFLNVDHPKLKCVDHKDFIDQKYLPTFSSHAIEVNLHRIKGLSERFVYFNDDMFVVSPMKKTDFFVDGKPCEAAVMDMFVPIREPLFTPPCANTVVINRNFVKKDVLKKNFRRFYSLKYGKNVVKNIQLSVGRYFAGFHNYHQPTSLLKSTFNEVWEIEEEVLRRSTSHRFRILTDVNQWLFKDWQICKGNIHPRSVKKFYYIVIDNKNDLNNAVAALDSRKYKLVCLNDGRIDDFDALKSDLTKAFERLLPEKSSFEK